MRRGGDPLPLRVYRRALFILPRGFRQRYGAGMAAMLADEWRERRGIARGVLLGSALLDLLWTAAIERMGRSRERHDKGFGMRSSKALGISWLDFKLGFRMLIRYPGLTVVAGFALAFAIAVGTATFELVTQYVQPTLPLEDGDRIVGVRNWDAVAGQVEERGLHDFVTWLQDLGSVEDLGAFRTIRRNLILPDGLPHPVEVAVISASAFRVARVPPLLGRYLVEADEAAEAPPVLVIGYDVWQTRFGSDPAVVGRSVRLGSTVHTVVGVMPDGFGFPVSHGLWVPLRLDVRDYERGQGPEIRVFGRLAPGVSFDEAQAELTALGMRAAADFPDTHQHLRPQVLPYAESISNVSGGESVALMSINVFMVMLLVLVCANVALLMFARAATREREILVRNALGATRSRIIGQLFAEALVLGGVAALIGLGAAGFAVKGWLGVMEAERGGWIPFWFDDSLAPITVLYAGGLTVFGAVIAGVVPALKVTGRRVQMRLQRVAAGGSGAGFGGVWTTVIVAQVAVTVAFPATAFIVRRSVVQIRSMDVGFPAEQYLSVRLEMNQETQPGTAAETSQADFLVRFGATVRELERRLEDEPAIAGVTFADPLPRTLHPQRWIDVEGAGAAPQAELGHRVGTASVALDYFDVLGAPILSGRAFHSADLASEARVVIVNQSFVGRVLGGRNPIGRRLRYARPPDEAPGPWYQIVGVVKDLGMVNGDVDEDAGLYHPTAAGAAAPLHMAVHVRGDPGSFAPRLRTLAAAADPALRLHEVLPLDDVGSILWLEFEFLFRILVVLSSIALLLSLAGIYAVTAFTVSRRTREIGIRVALGAGARQVVTKIFRRSLAQVAFGVLAGGGLTATLAHLSTRGGLSAPGAALVVAYAALMMGVCLLACVVPTRRALGVQPTEAMRADR